MRDATLLLLGSIGFILLGVLGAIFLFTDTENLFSVGDFNPKTSSTGSFIYKGIRVNYEITPEIGTTYSNSECELIYNTFSYDDLRIEGQTSFSSYGSCINGIWSTYYLEFEFPDFEMLERIDFTGRIKGFGNQDDHDTVVAYVQFGVVNGLLGTKHVIKSLGGSVSRGDDIVFTSTDFGLYRSGDGWVYSDLEGNTDSVGVIGDKLYIKTRISGTKYNTGTNIDFLITGLDFSYAEFDPVCAEATKKYYDCGDNKWVVRCTCLGGEWSCVDNPENLCPDLDPHQEPEPEPTPDPTPEPVEEKDNLWLFLIIIIFIILLLILGFVFIAKTKK